jgi:hypothetical protein
MYELLCAHVDNWIDNCGYGYHRFEGIYKLIEVAYEIPSTQKNSEFEKELNFAKKFFPGNKEWYAMKHFYKKRIEFVDNNETLNIPRKKWMRDLVNICSSQTYDYSLFPLINREFIEDKDWLENPYQRSVYKGLKYLYDKKPEIHNQKYDKEFEIAKYLEYEYNVINDYKPYDTNEDHKNLSRAELEKLLGIMFNKDKRCK